MSRFAFGKGKNSPEQLRPGIKASVRSQVGGKIDNVRTAVEQVPERAREVRFRVQMGVRVKNTERDKGLQFALEQLAVRIEHLPVVIVDLIRIVHGNSLAARGG